MHSRLLAAVEVPLALQKEACLEPAEASVVRISNTAVYVQNSPTRHPLERGDIAISAAAILMQAMPQMGTLCKYVPGIYLVQALHQVYTWHVHKVHKPRPYIKLHCIKFRDTVSHGMGHIGAQNSSS